MARRARRPAAPAAPARALVLTGGVALGAFEAGVWAEWQSSGTPQPDWIVGSSAGAINAAIIAGNPPDARTLALQRFWRDAAFDPAPLASLFVGAPPPAGAWRTAWNEAAAVQTLLLGRAGLFRPRLVPARQAGEAPALHDLQPLIDRLPGFVDFERLNAGEPRVSLVANDVVSGERVVFDTAHGSRIGPAHVAACGALLPVFAPIEIDGRLLGDGGLATNAPIDLVLDEPRAGPLECVVVELFARGGSRPDSLGASATRAGDIGFGNQTRLILEGRIREHRLRALAARLLARLPQAARRTPEAAALLEWTGQGGEATLVLLGYRGGRDEAGAVKAFDFSRATLHDRWDAGVRGMAEALARLAEPDRATRPAEGLLVHMIEIAAEPPDVAAAAGV